MDLSALTLSGLTYFFVILSAGYTQTPMVHHANDVPTEFKKTATDSQWLASLRQRRVEKSRRDLQKRRAQTDTPEEDMWGENDDGYLPDPIEFEDANLGDQEQWSVPFEDTVASLPTKVTLSQGNNAIKINFQRPKHPNGRR